MVLYLKSLSNERDKSLSEQLCELTNFGKVKSTNFLVEGINNTMENELLKGKVFANVGEVRSAVL